MGLNGEGMKNVHFQKNWPYLRNGEIGSRLLLITNSKWHTPLQIRWKPSTLDDLEGHWQPVRSAISDSWASCSLSSALYANWLSRKCKLQLTCIFDAYIYINTTDICKNVPV